MCGLIPVFSIGYCGQRLSRLFCRKNVKWLSAGEAKVETFTSEQLKVSKNRQRKEELWRQRQNSESRREGVQQQDRFTESDNLIR